MALREQLEERNRQWRSFNEWEAEQALFAREPAAILTDLGTLLGWLPSEGRRQDSDPDERHRQNAGSVGPIDAAMTDLEGALAEVAAALEHCHLPYMLIGGLAVASTGEPRATIDVDISAWVRSCQDA